MANLTIVIADDLLRKARIRAAELGTSVNAVLRDYLATWVNGGAQRETAIDRLLDKSKRARSARAGRRWTRDELYER